MAAERPVDLDDNSQEKAARGAHPPASTTNTGPQIGLTCHPPRRSEWPEVTRRQAVLESLQRTPVSFTEAGVGSGADRRVGK